MKQLLILSGKGGTGKTTVASSFISLSEARSFADCDVDAPNLHLVTRTEVLPEVKDYFGLPKAFIDPDICIGCDMCRQECRFEAISCEGDLYTVDNNACEGCGVCEYVCPVSAVSMHDEKAGEMMLYREKTHTFSTAKLRMGSGTSGMLVTEVKKRLMPYVDPGDLVIIDGSPGIGCPVIASLSGVDMVLIVAEPTLSGISDMERIIGTALNFKIRTTVCINKADINDKLSDEIEKYCTDKKLHFLGRIPYDPLVVQSVNDGKPVADLDCPAGNAIKIVYNKSIKLLEEMAV